MMEKKWILGAVLLLLVGLIAWNMSGDTSATRTFAAHLPADTLLTVTLDDLTDHLAGLSALREDLDPEDPVRAMLLKLDARWLDEATWEEFGIDLTRPLGVAMLTRPMGTAVVTMGLTDLEAAKQGLPALMKALQMGVEPEETTFVDTPGMVLVPGEWGALLSADQAIVFGGPGVVDVRGAQDAEDGLRRLGERLAGLEEDERLGTDENFVVGGATLDGAPLVVWLNPFRLRKLVDDELWAPLRTWLRSVRSLVVSSTHEGDALTLEVRAVMRDPDDATELFGEQARALAPWDHIPGPVLGATHAVLDTDVVMALASSIAAPILGEGGLEETIDDLESELGLDLNRYGRAFNGEFGFLISDLSEDSPLGTQTFFAGLSDEEAIRKGLRKLARMLVDEGVEVEREIEDDAILYSVQVEGISFGAALFQGRLWLSSAPRQLEDMMERRITSVWSDPRADEVMAPIKGSEGLVSVWDGAKLTETLDAFPGLTDVMPAWMWQGQDRGSFTLAAEDGVLVGTLRVQLNDDAHPIFEAIGGLLANPLVLGALSLAAMEFRVTEAEAAVAEEIFVQDSLDRIYQGASAYYTTPHITVSGEKLPCQFPTSADCAPAGSACDLPDQVFPADPEAWMEDTWQALRFSVQVPSPYRFCVSASGTLAEARMTVTMEHDQGCDGTWESVIENYVGDPNASLAECGAPLKSD